MILLDIMLPDGDGRDFLRFLRGLNNNVPVIVMTARSEISDRVDLLDIGADDYILSHLILLNWRHVAGLFLDVIEDKISWP